MVGRKQDHQRDYPPRSSESRETNPLGLNERRGHTSPSDTHLDIARRLMAHAGSAGQGVPSTTATPDTLAESTGQIYNKLRVLLTELLGKSGFRSLLARAIFTAHASTKLLVGEDGQFGDPSGAPLGPAHLPAIEATLASAFDLLSDVIGENLVLRLIHQAWPDFAVLLPFAPRPEVVQ